MRASIRRGAPDLVIEIVLEDNPQDRHHSPSCKDGGNILLGPRRRRTADHASLSCQYLGLRWRLAMATMRISSDLC